MHQEKLQFSPGGIISRVYPLDWSERKINKIYFQRRELIPFIYNDDCINQKFSFNRPDYYVDFKYCQDNIDSIHVYKIVNRNIFTHTYDIELLTIFSNEDLIKYGDNLLGDMVCPDFNKIKDNEETKKDFINYLVYILNNIESTI